MKFTQILKVSLVVIIILIVNLSCDAPHSNPFDPENPNKQFLKIEGYVYSFSLPRVSLQNALVLWLPENKAAITSENGYFKIETFSKKEGWLVVMLDGYRPESIFVNWYTDRFYKEFFLNQIPKLDSAEFYSVLINQYPNIQNVNLIVRAKIIDKDNDLDSVLIQNQSMNIRIPLNYNTQTKFFEGEFSEYDFGVDDLIELIGVQLDFIVKDINGFEFKIGDKKLNRIIKDEILLESPINYDSTSSKPLLIWRRFMPGFKFTYNVEIYDDKFPPAIVWSKSNISMDSTSIQVDSNLSSGNYFWVLWCVDQFLNRARSRPASFRVK